MALVSLPALLDLLFPPRCLACGDDAWDEGATPLCAACRRRLPPPEARCPACGRSVGPLGVTIACVQCAGPTAERDALQWSGDGASLDRRALRGVVVSWPYTGAARDLVLAAKFALRPRAARFLGAGLVDPLQGAGVPGDLVVPVPLSRARLRQRGFNQAAVMARMVARGTGLELRVRALRRLRDDQPQSGRSRAKRLHGPRGAFVARPVQVRDRCVLLVDDVLTTGATVHACARALRAAGARAVTAAVACRAERR